MIRFYIWIINEIETLKHQIKKNANAWLVLGALVVCFIIIENLSESDSTTSQGDASPLNAHAQSSENHSIEYKLAVIDEHYTPSDKLKRKYGRALDILQRYCTDTRMRLGDYSVTGQKIFKEHSIDMSNLLILKKVGILITPKAKRGEVGKCSSIFTHYVTDRNNSYR